ncbi:amidohydrolase [Embleya scabrispora]|uniref:amidohydrolase n=1 Tax=Embleya scabrispora TaxID=159449 RepID=UPI00036EE5C9|nr:amidohydrolase family protein [Embleya scabrispora]MYS83117.1 amidohydrolase family protein [Streptomyces sp. SID5474]
MTTLLLRNGAVHSPADPFATAMVVENDTIAWIGAEGAAAAHVDAVDAVLDLAGALVTPAFVDAHVHATATGLALTGLDLTGAPSLAYALSALEDHAKRRGLYGVGHVLLGHGWDDTAWPEGRPPTPAELDRATGGATVYLSRTDVHSAACSPALLALVPGEHGDAPLAGSVHHAARAAANAALTSADRIAAQRVARARAAALGIGTVHECGGPEIAGEADFRALLALARDEAGPDVVGYWGALADDAEHARTLRADLGAHGLGGDLFIDGSLGSHTACLHAPYSDDPAAGTGLTHLAAEQVAAHLAACTRAGVQAGFHAIGDAAIGAVTTAARTLIQGPHGATFRALRHRVEHAELLDAKAVAAFAELGLTASVQPAFDAAWGGPDGMYVRRLGAERAALMNPLAALSAAGVPLAFGSDAPVTPLDPWGTVRAAAFHRTPEQRISVRAAFAAHTRGGHRATGRDDAGVLVPGAPATYAVWDTTELVVQAPDSRLSGWSTDPRSGTPGLPDLAPELPLPRCLRTAVRGTTVYEAEGALGRT